MEPYVARNTKTQITKVQHPRRLRRYSTLHPQSNGTHFLTNTAVILIPIESLLFSKTKHRLDDTAYPCIMVFGGA